MKKILGLEFDDIVDDIIELYVVKHFVEFNYCHIYFTSRALALKYLKKNNLESVYFERVYIFRENLKEIYYEIYKE